MKEELRKHWILYGVLYVIIVVILLIGLWQSLPYYHQPWMDAGTEEELMKELKKDMRDVVYPDFFKEEYGMGSATYRKEIPSRARFGTVKGYSISGNMVLADKRFEIYMLLAKNRDTIDNPNFEYRGIEGYMRTLISVHHTGKVVFTMNGYEVEIRFTPLDQNEMTEEEIAKVNEEVMKIAERLIDMKLDGDTLGN